MLPLHSPASSFLLFLLLPIFDTAMAQNVAPSKVEQEPLEEVYSPILSTKTTDSHSSKPTKLASAFECFEIEQPYQLIGQDGILLTKNVNLQTAVEDYESQHPGKHITGFVFPFNAILSDGSKQLITDMNQVLSVIQDCTGE